MELAGTIARSLGLKQTDGFTAVETFNVGMSTFRLPSILSIRFSGNHEDTHHTSLKTLRKDDQDMDAYDVWEGNDDTVKCMSCKSPEAIDRCIKVSKERVPGTNTWVERTDHIVPLCSDCSQTKLGTTSGGYVGVTMPPPSGDITGYTKDGEHVGHSRSAGHNRNRGISRTFTRYVTCPAGPVAHARMQTGTVSKGKVSVINTATGKKASFYDNRNIIHLERVRS